MAERTFTLSDSDITFSDTGHILTFGRLNRGKREIGLIVDNSVKHTDVINPGAAKDRQAFTAPLNGLADVVDDELQVLATKLRQPDAEAYDEGGRRSQATVMAALVRAMGAELFHDPNGEPYATIAVDGVRQTHPLKGGGFRHLIAWLYYGVHGSAPGGQATQDALGVLSGEALFTGPEVPVWTRLARLDDALYLDLGNADWQAIAITAAGWEVIDSGNVPVKFRRPSGMLPLPMPERGGSLDGLRVFLGLDDADDDTLVLSQGWLVGTFLTSGGRAILELSGEQGSGKSTKARMFAKLVDPCTVPLRKPPREEGDLLIACRNRMIVAFDNLSKVEEWLSDAFCRISTGGGLGKRTLYSNDDETLIESQRPIILTGINGVAERSDMLDRTIRLQLAPIADDKRETEEELWNAFDAAHSAMLGGLLDAVSCAIRNRDSVRLDRIPRLADFVRWVEAAAPALGWQPGAFLAAFEDNRGNAHMIAIEASPVGPAILDFMATHEHWDGTATALLEELNAIVTDAQKREKVWPKRANTLAKHLKRLSPNLAKVGVWIGWDRASRSRIRKIVLDRNHLWDDPYTSTKNEGGESSSASSPPPDDEPNQADFRGFSADDPDDETSSAHRPQDRSQSSARTCLDCGWPLDEGENYRCAICAAAAEAAMEDPDAD